MALFRVRRTTSLAPSEAWRRLTDWPRHGDAVPLTRVTVTTPPPAGPGTELVARTGIGPLAFDDRMEVTVWRPPREGGGGRCRLEKRGRLVRGWAEIEVAPDPGGAGRTLIGWHEELRLPLPLPRPVDGLLARVARRAFARAVDRLLGDGTAGVS